MSKFGKLFLVIVMTGIVGATAITCGAQTQERLLFDDENQDWITVEEQSVEVSGALGEVRELMEQEQYGKAEKILGDYLAVSASDDVDRAEVMFLYGEVAFLRGQYGKADERYHELINEYPSTRQFALALRRELEIAKVWLAGKKKRVLKIFRFNAVDEALDILSMIEQLAGGYRIAEVAIWIKADYFFQTGQFELAQMAYMRLADNVNSTRYQMAAMFGASASAIAAFPGVSFDDSALLDAEELYGLCLVKYPTESRKRDVPLILDQITLRRAQKDYEVARFYLHIKQFEASAYYYDYVIRAWPDTLYAQKAQIELDGLNLSE